MRQNNSARNWPSEAHHSARWTSNDDDRNVLPAQCAMIMIYNDEVNQTERASIYNALPEEAIDTLIEFMSSFEKKAG